MLMSSWLFWSSSVTTSSHDLISQLQRHLTQSTIEELKVKAKSKMLNQLGCKLFAAPACQHLGSSGQPANWRITNELSQNWNLYTDFFLYYMPTQWPDLIDPHATDNSEVTCEARRRQPSSHHKEKTREELLIVAISNDHRIKYWKINCVIASWSQKQSFRIESKIVRKISGTKEFEATLNFKTGSHDWDKPNSNPAIPVNKEIVANFPAWQPVSKENNLHFLTADVWSPPLIRGSETWQQIAVDRRLDAASLSIRLESLPGKFIQRMV